MGLASALSVALTGLTSAETQIDVVGNNLANSQTVGFKESGVEFTTQFLQTLSLGSQPTTVSGGTNPRQTGLGTQVAEITPNFSQGTIQTSSSVSDVALQGDGFFIIQSVSGENLYTRSGIFKTNSQNELVTINGNRLLGYTVDDDFQLQSSNIVPIEIPVGSVRVAQATKNVFMEGTLPPTGDVADTAEVIDSAVLGDSSVARPDSSGVTITASPTPLSTGVTVTGSSTGGTLTPGTYRYRVASLDSAGTESAISDELSSIALTGAEDTITLSNLPTDPTGASTQMRIYRTQPDGTEFFRVGTVDLSQTTTFVDNSAAALDTNQPLDQAVLTGNYSYLIAYSNGQTETRPSELIGTVNVTQGRIQLQNLPDPPPAGPNEPVFDRIRIYRNLATDASTFYMVNELPASTSTLHYTDNTSDADLVANGTVIDLDGPKITPNTLLTDVIRRDELSYEQVFEEGTLSFTGRKSGRALDTKTFEITSESTVQDLTDFIRDSVGIQRAADDSSNPIPNSLNVIPNDTTALTPGSTITSSGRIRFVSNNGVDNAVSIGLTAFTIAKPDGTVATPNLGFDAVQTAKGTGAVADFLVYDTLGVPINVRITAVMEARDGQSTTYRWFADSPDNDPLSGIELSVGTGLITYDGQGNFISATNSQVSVERRNTPAASPLNFDLDFSSISGLASDTASIAASRQDGSSAGTLASFSIGEDGVIRGAFSNGVSRTLGQIRLARFANPTGLVQRGQNTFATGPNSGLPVEGSPGENGVATLVSGAVELSNTDIGQNLIELVLATTQYRGNTRVITASQQLLEELLNLRR